MKYCSPGKLFFPFSLLLCFLLPHLGNAAASADNPLQYQTSLADMVQPTPSAAETLELSVEQTVLLALQNNRDLQVQHHIPVITGTFTQIEQGIFDPELFAEIDYFKEQTEETSSSSNSKYDAVEDDFTAIAGLRKLLPTGTTIEASLSQERSRSDQEPEQQSARLGLSVTQSLLRGFGSAVNLVSVHQAEIDALASIHELRGFSESLLADTEIAYWNYVLAKDEIAIFEESLVVARKQRKEVELRIEVGLLPEIEVAAAKAEEALRVQALINSYSLLEQRRLQLLQRINPNPEGRLDQQINAISDPRLSPQPITDLKDRLQLAEQSRSDLNEARLRLRQRRLETVATRNGILPRLDFFISLGKTGFDDNFNDSFRSMDGNKYDFTAGLRLNYLLGNRKAKAENLAAQVSREQALDAIANLRQMVHLDVRLALNELERSRQQIDASRASRFFQEQTLAAEQERFDVGTSTALLVAQAQRDLLQTQIAEIEAIINYRIALVKLYLAEGSLLDRRGVRVMRDEFNLGQLRTR
ncbi:Outer membrane protein TolC [Desulfuromusa kysingii]|uniref:Outer membrane protein TolC n=1 Tax=Desulfuromusa kysingii TaxID=37625 RepID=A0A1H3W2J4_9BACT|nr:TolC family protein [Desulfuromusa kysingii]SDZ80634.1 Outer membrane protein TolC [Desulfuromusa kysingii]